MALYTYLKSALCICQKWTPLVALLLKVSRFHFQLRIELPRYLVMCIYDVAIILSVLLFVEKREQARMLLFVALPLSFFRPRCLDPCHTCSACTSRLCGALDKSTLGECRCITTTQTHDHALAHACHLVKGKPNDPTL